MECLDVMLRNVSHHPIGYADAQNPYVSTHLVNAVIHANDQMELSPRERSAYLWPILPKVLGSGVVENPPEHDEFYSRLVGEGLARYEGFLSIAHLLNPSKENENGWKHSDNEAYVTNLKRTIEVFWDMVGTPPPLQDYTTEHYNNLVRWCNAQTGDNRDLFLEYTEVPFAMEATSIVAPA